MANNGSFGDVLRNAREDRNEDLLTVARKIRIRPDVLATIEAANLDEMPPRGYSRNMVNAYARYLGLNPTEVVKMYQDALFEHQVGAARAQLPQTGFDMPDSRFSGMTHPDPDATQRINTRRSNACGRDFVSSSLDDITMQMNPVGSNGRDYRGRGERVGNSISDAHYTNIYSAPQNDKNSSSKMPFFIAAVIVFLLCVILVFAGTIMHKPAAEAPVDTMNVTGMKDSNTTTPSQDTPMEAAKPAPKPIPVLPEKTVISFEVKDGETAYIEIQIDGKYVLAQDVAGPHKETYDVTGELIFVTTAASSLVLTQDGKEITLEPDEGSIARKTFTYEEFKTAWEEEHKEEIEAAQAAQDSASTNAQHSDQASTSDTSNASSDGASTPAQASATDATKSDSSVMAVTHV